MLVLTRRPGEQIVIGDGIRVTVVSLGPGRVKIGIEAPPNVRIDRQEIHERTWKALDEYKSREPQINWWPEFVKKVLGKESAVAETQLPAPRIVGGVTQRSLATNEGRPGE